MRSLVLLFFAVATFLLGSIAVDAELARTDSAVFVSIVWVVMILGSVAFLVAAVVFARRSSST
jgi:hypothetical protein